MFCKKCGAQLPDGSMFCEKCGAKLDAAPQMQPQFQQQAQQTTYQQAQPTQQSQPQTKGKLPVIIGGVAVVAFILIWVIPRLGSSQDEGKVSISSQGIISADLATGSGSQGNDAQGGNTQAAQGSSSLPELEPQENNTQESATGGDSGGQAQPDVDYSDGGVYFYDDPATAKDGYGRDIDGIFHFWYDDNGVFHMEYPDQTEAEAKVAGRVAAPTTLPGFGAAQAIEQPTADDFAWVEEMANGGLSSTDEIANYFADYELFTDTRQAEGDWQIAIGKRGSEYEYITVSLHTEGNTLQATLHWGDGRADTLLSGKWKDNMVMTQVRNDEMIMQFGVFFFAGSEEYCPGGVMWTDGTKGYIGLHR